MRYFLTVIVFATLAACGGSSGPDTGPWVGNWNSAGTQSTTCPVLGTTTNQITGLDVLAAGSKAGTITTTFDNCTLIWDLAGSKITIESGQTCTVSEAGVNVTVTLTQSSATLSGGTITGSNTGSTNNGCSFMQQYTLTRM
jgi:hypothetical protein